MDRRRFLRALGVGAGWLVLTGHHRPGHDPPGHRNRPKDDDEPEPEPEPDPEPEPEPEDDEPDPDGDESTWPESWGPVLVVSSAKVTVG